MIKKSLNVKLVLFIILISVFLTSGCNSNVIRQKEEGDSVVGSGKVIRAKIDVGSFQGVKPMLQANLYVTQDGTINLEIEPYENIFVVI